MENSTRSQVEMPSEKRLATSLTEIRLKTDEKVVDFQTFQ